MREVKGVGGDLEALPAGVGPLPALLLQPNRDFSALLVPTRVSEWEGWRISGLGSGMSLGTLQQSAWSLGWTILPRTQTTEWDPCSPDPSLLLPLKGKVPFSLQPSCKIFLGLHVFLSVPVDLRQETSVA